LRDGPTGLKFNGVRTLSLEEAVAGLGKWLELAIAGEGIRIRQGDAVVELRPVSEQDKTERRERLAPREALRQLQAEARLTPNQAQDYLEELHEERLAAEMRRPA
jgi:antitoxin (DNA-binding transcriptional repressor) of toxin-antitoxin stability system